MSSLQENFTQVEEGQSPKNIVLGENLDFEMFESIYQNINMAIWVMDVNDKEEFIFVGLNPNHEKLTGLLSEKVKGKKPHEFLSMETAQAVTENYQKCLRAKSIIEYEEQLFLNDKETWWSTRLIPLKDYSTGKIYRIIGTSLNITEKKQTELKLQELLELNQKVLSHTPSAILIYTLDGDCIYCNQMAVSILEAASRGELFSKKLQEIPLWHSTEINRIFDDFQRKSDPIIFPSISVDILEKKKYLQIHFIPFMMNNNKIVLQIINDITDLKTAEQEALKEKIFSETLINTLPIPLFFQDISGIIQGCNPAYKDFTGIPKEQLINKSIFDIQPPGIAGNYEKMDRILWENSDSPQHFETVFHTHYEETKDVLLHKAVYKDNEGNNLGIIGLMYDISEKKRFEKNLIELSILDELTGLYNKRGMNEFYTKEWARSVRNHTPLSVIMIDIDFFKLYNDHFGHQAGDSCLFNVATAVHQNCRRPGDILCRYGGEEFLAILPETKLAGALVVAENIRSGVENLKIKRPDGNPVSISLGVASLNPGKETEASALIKMADEALYLAKNNGRNRVEVYQ